MLFCKCTLRRAKLFVAMFFQIVCYDSFFLIVLKKNCLLRSFNYFSNESILRIRSIFLNVNHNKNDELSNFQSKKIKIKSMNFLFAELINQLNANHQNIFLHIFLIASIAKVKIIKSISILSHQASKLSIYQVFRKIFEKTFFTIYFII